MFCQHVCSVRYVDDFICEYIILFLVLLHISLKVGVVVAVFHIVFAEKFQWRRLCTRKMFRWSVSHTKTSSLFTHFNARILLRLNLIAQWAKMQFQSATVRCASISFRFRLCVFPCSHLLTSYFVYFLVRARACERSLESVIVDVILLPPPLSVSSIDIQFGRCCLYWNIFDVFTLSETQFRF